MTNHFVDSVPRTRQEQADERAVAADITTPRPIAHEAR